MILHTSSRDWDLRFLRLAREVSTWSKDASTKVGAVIVDPRKHIVSVGYNGFPASLRDDYNITREEKLARTVHAEMNALLNAPLGIPVKSSLYVYPLPPCDVCFLHLLSQRIRRVAHLKMSDAHAERWGPAFARTQALASEAGVTLIAYEMEDLHGYQVPDPVHVS